MKLSTLYESIKTGANGQVRGLNAKEDCTHCKASLEKGEDGKCNQCGELYHTGPFKEDYGRIIALFDTDEKLDGLLDIRRKPDGKLWINIGDWSDIGAKAIKAVCPDAEVADEAGGVNRLGIKLYPEN